MERWQWRSVLGRIAGVGCGRYSHKDEVYYVLMFFGAALCILFYFYYFLFPFLFS